MLHCGVEAYSGWKSGICAPTIPEANGRTGSSLDQPPSSGLKAVTETITAIKPALDGPLGMEGGVTYTRSNTDHGGGSELWRCQGRSYCPPRTTPELGHGTYALCTRLAKHTQLPGKWKGWGWPSWELAKQDGRGLGRSNWQTVLYPDLAGDNALHEKVVALSLSKEAGKSPKEWEPIFERIITVTSESKCQNTTII